jgi:hypothetical protein
MWSLLKLMLMHTVVLVKGLSFCKLFESVHLYGDSLWNV